MEVVEGGGTGEIKVDENMKGDFQFPFVGINYVVTSDYGGRWGTLHAGIDLVAYRGAPVSAVGDGKLWMIIYLVRMETWLQFNILMECLHVMRTWMD